MIDKKRAECLYITVMSAGEVKGWRNPGVKAVPKPEKG